MPGIIVGIDGSASSHRALEWAVNEAAVRRTPLTVLTVNQAFVGYWDDPDPGDPDLTEKAREAAQAETDSVLEKVDAGSRPSSVTVRAVNGLPAKELLSESADADMIVVGSRGAGRSRRLLLGSVSTTITHHARCPVAVIPAHTGQAHGG